MIPKNIDDKALAWKVSLFLFLSSVLSAAVNASRGIALGEMFGNPLFRALVAATFLSLLFWLMRNFNVSRNRSLAAVAVIAAVMLVIGASGIRAYVVMSNSMRQGNDTSRLYFFWGKLGYSKENFSSFPSSGGFQAGDLLIAARTDNLKIGDVAVDVRSDIPLTHRIFFLNETAVITTGDSYPPIDARNIQQREIRPRGGIYGKVLFVVPKGGILKVMGYCLKDPSCSPPECLDKGNCGDTRAYE